MSAAAARRRSRPVAALVLASVASLGAASSGCYSKSTGYQGKLTFAYAAGLEFENFVKPIAPGAKLDVVAFANGTEDKLVVTGATSSRAGVLAIEAVKDRIVVLKAGEPGVAEIEITARDASGNVLVDRMFFHVEKPTAHAIEHVCTSGEGAVYVRGERIDILHHLATSDGRPVIGYAYVPLTVDPSSGLESIPVPQGSTYYSFRAREKKERITIKSTVDGSLLSARVIDRGELKDAKLDCGGDDECRTFEGDTMYVVARVGLGDAAVCNQTALTKARSLTPDICTVTAKLDEDDGSETNREQLALLRGLKFGVCKYEMTLPELDGGRGVTLTGEAKIGRIQFPGEGAKAPVPVPPPARAHVPADVEEKLRRTASAWFLVGAGWLAPNVIALGCLAWMRRRKRRAADAE